MAEKFYREMSCDRCGKQISLTDGGPGETMSNDDGKAGSKPTVSFSMEGEKSVEYKDLCDKCKDRCRDLLNMAGNRKVEPKRKKKGAKPDEKGKGEGKKNGAPATA